MDILRFANEPLTNMERKLLILLIIDTSVEMNMGHIDVLNESLQTFFSEIYKTDDFIDILELGIIESHNNVIMRLAPKTLDKNNPQKPPFLEATAVKSNLMAAIEVGIELIQARKKFYRQEAITYYRPKIIVLSHCENIKYSEEQIARINHDMKYKKYGIEFIHSYNADLDFITKITGIHEILDNRFNLLSTIKSTQFHQILEQDNVIPETLRISNTDINIDWMKEFDLINQISKME